MMHLTMLLADCVLVADRDMDGEGFWTVQLHDMGTGNHQRISMTDVQLAAMVALGIGAEQGVDLIDKLRLIPQSVDLDRSLAPIP
jgi:hypothetical protein